MMIFTKEKTKDQQAEGTAVRSQNWLWAELRLEPGPSASKPRLLPLQLTLPRSLWPPLLVASKYGRRQNREASSRFLVSQNALLARSKPVILCERRLNS